MQIKMGWVTFNKRSKWMVVFIVAFIATAMFYVIISTLAGEFVLGTLVGLMVGLPLAFIIGGIVSAFGANDNSAYALGLVTCGACALCGGIFASASTR